MIENLATADTSLNLPSHIPQNFQGTIQQIRVSWRSYHDIMQTDQCWRPHIGERRNCKKWLKMNHGIGPTVQPSGKWLDTILRDEILWRLSIDRSEDISAHERSMQGAYNCDLELFSIFCCIFSKRDFDFSLYRLARRRSTVIWASSQVAFATNIEIQAMNWRSWWCNVWVYHVKIDYLS